MGDERMEFARNVLTVLKARGVIGFSLQIERGHFPQEPTDEEFILMVHDAMKIAEDYEDRRRREFMLMIG